MGKYHDLMNQSLVIKGFSQKTIDSYLRSMRSFIGFIKKPPNQISYEDITKYQYFLKMKNVSYSTFNICVSAIRYFYQNVIDTHLNIDRIAYSKVPKKLPVVLTKEEVIAIYKSFSNIKHKTIFLTIYSCGLRVSESVRLHVNDIDSKRMMIRIVNAKGKKDRYVPLPEKLLKVLRDYWKSSYQKPKEYLFPSGFQNGIEKPLSIRTVQTVIKNAVLRTGIKKNISVHTLRHSFATHLLEAGVDLRRLQIIMGHKSLSTTMTYVHVASNFLNSIISPLDQFDLE
jgi:integrase/recombinase XerD